MNNSTQLAKKMKNNENKIKIKIDRETFVCLTNLIYYYLSPIK